jgi:hypothetical protein
MMDSAFDDWDSITAEQAQGYLNVNIENFNNSTECAAYICFFEKIKPYSFKNVANVTLSTLYHYVHNLLKGKDIGGHGRHPNLNEQRTKLLLKKIEDLNKIGIKPHTTSLGSMAAKVVEETKQENEPDRKFSKSWGFYFAKKNKDKLNKFKPRKLEKDRYRNSTWLIVIAFFLGVLYLFKNYKF